MMDFVFLNCLNCNSYVTAPILKFMCWHSVFHIILTPPLLEQLQQGPYLALIVKYGGSGQKSNSSWAPTTDPKFVGAPKSSHRTQFWLAQHPGPNPTGAAVSSHGLARKHRDGLLQLAT